MLLAGKGNISYTREMGFLLVAGLAWQLCDTQWVFSWKTTVGARIHLVLSLGLGSAFPHGSTLLTWSPPTWTRRIQLCFCDCDLLALPMLASFSMLLSITAGTWADSAISRHQTVLPLPGSAPFYPHPRSVCGGILYYPPSSAWGSRAHLVRSKRA